MWNSLTADVMSCLFAGAPIQSIQQHLVSDWISEEKHLQGKARHRIISQRIPHNTSSLLLFLSSRPPVTTTCWFKWAALGASSPLGKIYSGLNNTFERVHTSRCICTGMIKKMILMVIVCMIELQLDDGFNNCHKCCHYLYNSSISLLKGDYHNVSRIHDNDSNVLTNIFTWEGFLLLSTFHLRTTPW